MQRAPDSKFIVNEFAADLFLQNFASLLTSYIQEDYSSNQGSRSISPISKSTTSVEASDEDEYEVINQEGYDPTSLFLMQLNKELQGLNCDSKTIGSVSQAFERLFLYSQEVGKQRVKHARKIYQELISALEEVQLPMKKENTQLLVYVYKNLFANMLNLIEQLGHKMQLADVELVNQDIDVTTKVKKSLGKYTADGIYDSEGKALPILDHDHPESNWSKIAHGIFGIDYFPALYNLFYMYSEKKPDSSAQRLRIGAQIREFLSGGNKVARVPNIFRNYLHALQDDPKVCKHLYINLMKRTDETSHWFSRTFSERAYEAARSNLLHVLEAQIPGVVVVTLPADNSFFNCGFDKHHRGKTLVVGDIERDFININELFANIVESIDKDTNDFYFSADTKVKVFGSADRESIRKTILPLFDATCKKILGAQYTSLSKISYGQRQAILFHFVKHELTSHMILKLEPKYFNISCKDAIDRGGVHNLWDIFCDRIESGKGMSLVEFESMLCLPAVLVKDRPVNDHLYFIVNVLGYYYTNLNDEKKALISWAEKWLQIHSVYGKNFMQSYSWRYHENAEDDFYKLCGGKYNELYAAVASGDLNEVKRLLESGKKLSIWDSDNENDTILTCAAEIPHYEIFSQILEYHDKNTNKLPGLRSSMPDGKKGTALNCVLSTFYNSHGTANREAMTNAIAKYIQSITEKRSYTVNYNSYTSECDNNGKTPMYYIACLNGADILDKIAEHCVTARDTTQSSSLIASVSSYFSGSPDSKPEIWDVFKFRLASTDGATVLEVAASLGNLSFINKLAEITGSNVYTEEEFNKAREIAEQRNRVNEGTAEVLAVNPRSPGG